MNAILAAEIMASWLDEELARRRRSRRLAWIWAAIVPLPLLVIGAMWLIDSLKPLLNDSVVLWAIGLFLVVTVIAGAIEKQSERLKKIEERLDRLEHEK
jgi:predicted tellurium resistance membrane protein TerC